MASSKSRSQDVSEPLLEGQPNHEQPSAGRLSSVETGASSSSTQNQSSSSGPARSRSRKRARPNVPPSPSKKAVETLLNSPPPSSPVRSRGKRDHSTSSPSARRSSTSHHSRESVAGRTRSRTSSSSRSSRVKAPSSPSSLAAQRRRSSTSSSPAVDLEVKPALRPAELSVEWLTSILAPLYSPHSPRGRPLTRGAVSPPSSPLAKSTTRLPGLSTDVDEQLAGPAASSASPPPPPRVGATSIGLLTASLPATAPSVTAFTVDTLKPGPLGCVVRVGLTWSLPDSNAKTAGPSSGSGSASLSASSSSSCLPPSVIVKFGAHPLDAPPEVVEFSKEQGLLASEATFYTMHAPKLIEGGVPLPRALFVHSDKETGQGVIVMTDLAVTTTGGLAPPPDFAKGLSLEQATAAFGVLGTLHGLTYTHGRTGALASIATPEEEVSQLGEFLKDTFDEQLDSLRMTVYRGGNTEKTTDWYDALLLDLKTRGPDSKWEGPADVVRMLEQLKYDIPTWMEESHGSENRVLCNSDMWMNNVIFRAATNPVSVAGLIDWEFYSLIPPMDDVNFLLYTSLSPELRRGHVRTFMGSWLACFLAALSPAHREVAPWRSVDDVIAASKAHLGLTVAQLVGSLEAFDRLKVDRECEPLSSRWCASLVDALEVLQAAEEAS